MDALNLPQVTPKQASVRNKLGIGHQLSFVLNHTATFTIEPIVGDKMRLWQDDPRDLRQTPFGRIWIGNSFGLFQHITQAPIIPIDETENPTVWMMALLNMVPAFRPLLGNFKKLDKADYDNSHEQDHIALHWTLDSRSGVEAGYLSMTAETLNDWLNKCQWQPIKRPLKHFNSNQLITTNTLLIASIYLSKREYLSLNLGDVVILQHPFFSADGVGEITLLNQICSLRWCAPGQYQITNIKELNMDTDHNTHSSQSVTQETEQDNAKLDLDQTRSTGSVETDQKIPRSLELNFTVEIGEIRLTLAELQTLAEGNILTPTGVEPGKALLKHHGSTVALGELVAVQGKIGLQLTAIELNHAH